MRRGSKPEIVVDGGKLIGVTLSADFCAEHEWGIKGIKRAFGIPDDIAIYGVDRRAVTKLPGKGLAWCDEGKQSGIVYFETWDDKPFKPSLFRDLASYGDTTLVGAWDEKTFAALSTDTKEQTLLLEMLDAIRSLDAVITLSGGGVFENAGLLLAIKSRLPEDVKKLWLDADTEAHEVRQYVESTGIEAKLKDAGCRYFALSPSRSKGVLKFWLNPYDQQNNNFGWYTLADLEEWIKGVGKIPKRSVTA